MANTLTAILPSIYVGLDQVSRELIGFIPLVQRDASFERVAVGQTVSVPVVGAASGGNITPAATPPDDGDVTPTTQTMTISKSKYSPIRWSGEEQRAVGPTGQYNKIISDQFAQAFRWLANQVEVDIAAAAYLRASRAYGTAGTAPFGTAGDHTDWAGVNRILDENGAPQGSRNLVVGGAARFNLEGKQNTLFKVNEAGTDALLRNRQLPYIHGMRHGWSAGIPSHVAGTGTLYDVNNGAGEAVGQTTITLDGGTAGATGIKAGDVVTFAGDTNKYVVGTGQAGAAGDIVLNDPGLRIAAADATELTIGASYTANIAFTDNAIVLAARAPAAPTEGDSADDVQFVTDPFSGITFEVRMYREYRRIRFEVGLAWGVGIVKEEHIAILLG